jgi:hypothetical protein
MRKENMLVLLKFALLCNQAGFSIDIRAAQCVRRTGAMEGPCLEGALLVTKSAVPLR